MYCKHCGKEIADDSAFCQYCGGQLQEQEKKKSSESLLNRFKSLSKGWQITMMIYAIWFVAGICYLVGSEDKYHYGQNVLLPVLIVVIVVPLLGLFLWYYFTKLRNTEKPVQNLKMTSVPLMDFAKTYGKMQVKTVANPDTNEVHSFCVFTNEQGIETRVEFGESLGPLRSQEIAERKEQLKVLQKTDGSFELCAK